MSVICQQCSTNIENSEISGRTVYCTCGYVFSVDPSSPFLKTVQKFILHICFFVFLISAGSVFIYYRKVHGKADLDYLVFQARSLFVTPSEGDLLLIGKLCNTSQAYFCAADVFEKLSEMDSKNFIYEANWIMALYNTNDFAQADAVFEKFQQKSYVTYDLLYAKANSHFKRGEKEVALKWYNQTLELNPFHRGSADKVSDILIEQKKYLEAMSFLLRFEAQFGTSPKVFKNKTAFLNRQLSLNDKKAIPEKEMTLTETQNQFYIPVQLKKMQSKQYLIDTGATLLTLNTKDLLKSEVEYKKLGTHTVRTADSVSRVAKVLIPEITIGPWTFENVEAYHCLTCADVIGMNVLSQMKTQIQSEEGIRKMKLIR